MGIVGGSVPACCQKNYSGLCALAWLSSAGMILRVIMVICFAAYMAKLNAEISAFRKCCNDNCDDDGAGGGYYVITNYTDDYYASPYNVHYTYTYVDGSSPCGDKMTYGSVASNNFVIAVMSTALIITAIWLIASLIGVGCGSAGALAEKAADTSNDQVPVAQGQVVITAQANVSEAHEGNKL